MSSSDENGANDQLSQEQEREFEEMLPWLLNGSLNESERKELESALSQSEKLRKEKALLLLLQQQVKQQEMPDVPLEFSWQKMKRQIADERNQLKKDSNNNEKKWRYIGIAASLLLVIQSSSLLVNWNQEELYVPLSSSSSNSRTNAALFTIQFVDEATALDIQQVLRQYHLNVISGPSSIGLYQISGPTDSINEAEKILAQLKSRSDVIAHVQQDE